MSDPVRLQHPMVYAGKWRKVFIAEPKAGDLYVSHKGEWLPIIRRADDAVIATIPKGDPEPILDEPE